MTQKSSDSYIKIYGAREHNLKNVSTYLPHNKITVITGVSGSGKSSLAFDTIHDEGQRRYIETFSAYSRNYLGNFERPDVDIIEGLSPVIAIKQKTTVKNPRSTVGTLTDIYDFFRLLYARIGKAYSYKTGKPMVKMSENEILNKITKTYSDKKIHILAPYIRGRKGHYRELFNKFLSQGFLYTRVDAEIIELPINYQVDRYKSHFIELVIDTFTVSEKNERRLKDAIKLAFRHGGDILMVLDQTTNEIKYFSKKIMCPGTGIAYDEPAPYTFSFNSPKGACSKCKGLGYVSEMDMNKIIPDRKISIKHGAIKPLGKYKNTLIFWQLEAIAKKYKVKLDTPVYKIPKNALDIILFGSNESFLLENSPLGSSSGYYLSFDGIITFLQNFFDSGESNPTQTKWQSQFYEKKTCPQCHGYRLKEESINFKINNFSIPDIVDLDFINLLTWVEKLPDNLDKNDFKIAEEILNEISKRLKLLVDIGLGYLSLNRQSSSLSGGESQRIRLATQIGSQLVNVLYIFDEPSIGLHQKDNIKLINSLKLLRDVGNTIIVVEHDKDIMLNADFIIDIGPGAGLRGGEILTNEYTDKIKDVDTITVQYLNGKRTIPIAKNRRKGNGKWLSIKGAYGHNLKNISVDFPLGTFICISGVSGSGKSTLVYDTLYAYLRKYFYQSKDNPLPFESIEGIENIDKVIAVDQSAIGKTIRSNPATYIGVFDEIRKLFAVIPEAKIRGYKASRFSFNVKGGRCEECRGAGVKTIEMNFLPNVYVQCPVCFGKRYNRETLSVLYKGKSINDVLNMTVNVAVEFFENIPLIFRKLKILQEIGLGYLALGQVSPTLSGGEAQRLKLAAELAKRDTGQTLYILDEPTTGLHFQDIEVLLKAIAKLVDKGNTVMMIEHNIDILKNADYIIDLGPDGGKNGGELLATGTPEEIIKLKNKSYTADYLEQVLNYYFKEKV